MPEMRVGISDEMGDKLAVRSDGSITVSSLPEGALLYTTLVTDVAGTVAAQNLLSVFNPAASGKTLVFYQFIAYPYAGGATTATNSINVFRTTAASGGSLRAAADINKFITTQPNSIAEVRTGNPTTTNGNVPIISIPPAITSSGAGISGSNTLVPPTGAAFVCLPGEGVVVRVAAGDVDQMFDLGFTWSES